MWAGHTAQFRPEFTGPVTISTIPQLQAANREGAGHARQAEEPAAALCASAGPLQVHAAGREQCLMCVPLPGRKGEPHSWHLLNLLAHSCMQQDSLQLP